MKTKEYITVSELAKILGISRIAVFHKIQKGEIIAKKLGRIYAIPLGELAITLGKKLSEIQKKEIEAAVKRTVSEYGEVLKLLGRE